VSRKLCRKFYMWENIISFLAVKTSQCEIEHFITCLSKYVRLSQILDMILVPKSLSLICKVDIVMISEKHTIACINSKY